jgi:hypothetical protein
VKALWKEPQRVKKTILKKAINIVRGQNTFKNFNITSSVVKMKRVRAKWKKIRQEFGRSKSSYPKLFY